MMASTYTYTRARTQMYTRVGTPSHTRAIATRGTVRAVIESPSREIMKAYTATYDHEGGERSRALTPDRVTFFFFAFSLVRSGGIRMPRTREEVFSFFFFFFLHRDWRDPIRSSLVDDYSSTDLINAT